MPRDAVWGWEVRVGVPLLWACSAPPPPLPRVPHPPPVPLSHRSGRFSGYGSGGVVFPYTITVTNGISTFLNGAMPPRPNTCTFLCVPACRVCPPAHGVLLWVWVCSALS